MPERLLRQALVPSMAGLAGRPAHELAWNNVDLDVDASLLSFERPPSRRLLSCAGAGPRAP